VSRGRGRSKAVARRGEVVGSIQVAGRLDWVLVVVFSENSSADEGECTGHAVGKWMRGWRKATGVSDLAKSNEALRKSVLDDSSHWQRRSGKASVGCADTDMTI